MPGSGGAEVRPPGGGAVAHPRARDGDSGAPGDRVYPVAVTGKDALIIIPAYNEEGRVGQVVRDVRSAFAGADVLVIDDGSADDTAAEARRSGAMTLSLPINAGYGAALQTGYK